MKDPSSICLFTGCHPTVPVDEMWCRAMALITSNHPPPHTFNADFKTLKDEGPRAQASLVCWRSSYKKILKMKGKSIPNTLWQNVPDEKFLSRRHGFTISLNLKTFQVCMRKWLEASFEHVIPAKFGRKGLPAQFTSEKQVWACIGVLTSTNRDWKEAYLCCFDQNIHPGHLFSLIQLLNYTVRMWLCIYSDLNLQSLVKKITRRTAKILRRR